MKKWIVFLGLMIFYVIGFGQSGIDPVTGSMAGAGVASPGFWSILVNPAGIGRLKNPEGGYCVSQNYLMKELTRHMAGWVQPVKGSVFGLSIQSQGSNLYHNDKLALALARGFGRKITVGLQFDYLSTVFSEYYGKQHSYTFEAGAICEVSKGMCLAVALNNPLSIKRTEYEMDNYPSSVQVGIAYVVVPELTWFTDVSQTIGNKPLVRTGFEYRYLEKCQLRMGISGQPFTLAFGGSLFFRRMVLDISSGWQPVLGITPVLGFRYQFHK